MFIFNCHYLSLQGILIWLNKNHDWSYDVDLFSSDVYYWMTMEPMIGPCVTPLVYAAEDGDINTVKWHMENCSNPNQTKVCNFRLYTENGYFYIHGRLLWLYGVCYVAPHWRQLSITRLVVLRFWSAETLGNFSHVSNEVNLIQDIKRCVPNFIDHFFVFFFVFFCGKMHDTAISMAAKGGHLEVLKILIENGADVNLAETSR